MLTPSDQPQNQCPFRSARFPGEEFERKKPTYDGVQKMDVLPLAEKDWLRFDEDYLFLMEEKRQFMERCSDTVLKVSPQSLPAAQELLHTVIYWLEKYQSSFFEVNSDSIFCRRREIGIPICWEYPLQTITNIVPEDIVILTRDTKGAYRLQAGSLCFPSAWSLEEKFGLTVREIHDPVPTLNDRIGVKIDQLLEALTPERPVWRINFLINFNPKLSQIPELGIETFCTRPVLAEDSIGESLWLRQERETISKLPRSKAIVFTLKTYQTQLQNVPPSALEVLLNLHNHLDPTYRDTYRKLDPDEQVLFSRYIRSRITK